jgi:hypothetical protein
MAAAKDERRPGAAAGAAPAAEAAQPSPPRDDTETAARARAYLDLWERHLVHAALHLPAEPGAAAVAR